MFCLFVEICLVILESWFKMIYLNFEIYNKMITKNQNNKIVI